MTENKYSDLKFLGYPKTLTALKEKKIAPPVHVRIKPTNMIIGKEINLMRKYPQSKRNISGRLTSKTDEDRDIAKRFGKDFFDGSRSHGYGGFRYNPKFWEAVIPTFQHHWDLKSGDSLLDIGCAKGFMLYDLKRIIDGIKVCGIDISKYAIENAHPEIKKYCRIGNASELPFDDNSFDVLISITTLHNLEESDFIKALNEIERVKVRGSFITVDAYRNNEEKERMDAWNLTAKTVMHVDLWKELFRDVGYTGDYYWFIP
jgi:SAM-dependent methyltransferase